MQQPLISVIVPVYKVEQYLAACVDSILAQTYPHLEVILVDDGSPDACPQLCDDYAAKDARVKVIHQQNGGLAAARNAGLERATGALIGFVDSDDTIHPEMYTLLQNAMAAHQADISQCLYQHVDEKGQSIHTEALPPWQDVFEGTQEIIKQLEEDSNWYWVIACNKLYRRALFDTVRYPVGKLHEDEFVIHRLLLQCSRVACVSRPLYFYLRRSSSIMGTTYSLRRLDGAEANLDRASLFLSQAMPSHSAYHACSVALLVMANSYTHLDIRSPQYQERYRELCAQYRPIARQLMGTKLPLVYKARLCLNSISPYYTWKLLERFLRRGGEQ